MEDIRTQQVEALKVASEYSVKIVSAIQNIIKEYSGERKEDTDEYQKHIVTGLNWIFQIYNSTKELLAENGSTIDKNTVNESVKLLNKANDEQNDSLRAEAFQGILTFVEEFQKEASQY